MSKPYEIQVSPAAHRDLKKLPQNIRSRIIAKIDELAKDPRPHGYTQLKSRDVRYRVRVGDYRIIYKVFDDILVVLVLDIGDRKEIYR